jgi:hypothetical protein
MNTEIVNWLLESNEPWTRYRTLVDLLDLPPEDSEVQAARAEMVSHPQIQALIQEAAAWPGYTLKRHNDARHPIYKFSTLADFGLGKDDPGMQVGIEAVMSHVSPQGALQSLINIPKAFGGTNEDMWTWILCDTPTLLYALLGFGLGQDEAIQKSVQHLSGLVEENGWRCTADSALGKFHGPGRRSDPCPIVNVYALKALSLVPAYLDSPVTQAGIQALLDHWENQGEIKMYMFGIGTDFRKLKYPFVWYDILHVTDVLSRYSSVYEDLRFQEMVSEITTQAGENGHYTATSMYRAWKGWSFANKKQPSPWLTFLVQRIHKRVQSAEIEVIDG